MGYGEKERQVANLRPGDRKAKTGFSILSPIIPFGLGIARFLHDSMAQNGGEWETMGRFLSTDEGNQILSSDQLAKSLLAQARSQAKHPSLKTWTGVRDESDWSLAHNNPTKGLSRHIAPWLSGSSFQRQLKLDAMHPADRPTGSIQSGYSIR